MRYRRLKSSELEISKVSLGSAATTARTESVGTTHRRLDDTANIGREGMERWQA
jgi:aryl-alcohol dehydrogenase-like predicted oxidoreductase